MENNADQTPAEDASSSVTTEKSSLLSSQEGNMSDVMELCIFLRDRSGLHVSLDGGHQARAEDLLSIVMEERKFPLEAQKIFSMWLVSPLLELRMKHHHQPFHLVQQWDSLLRKFTDNSDEANAIDEPLLMFQRNVFYCLEEEKQVLNDQILCLLYSEAKYNILEGRYMVSCQDYDQLAGLQALIHLGKYDPKTHILPLYREHIKQFYPDIQCHRNRISSVLGKQRQMELVEARFMACHHRLSQSYIDQAAVERNMGSLYKSYLKICWSYPFYGSKYFTGQVEKPAGKFQFLRGQKFTPIWIAINTQGVCIINKEKEEVMLTVPFSKLCWECRYVGNDASASCLFLQFPCRENGIKVTKVLEVYSKQAKLMDALIQSCVDLIKKQTQVGDTVDGSLDSSFNSKIPDKLDKLCLSTFRTTGEMVN